MNIKKLLLDPKTVLVGVVGGFVIGLLRDPSTRLLFKTMTIYKEIGK